MKRSFLLLTMFLTVVACVEPNNGLNNPDDNPPHTSKKPLLESISSNDLGDSYKRCFIYDEKDNTLLSFGEQWSTGYIKYEFSEDRSSIQYKYENFSGEVNKSMTYTDIEYDTAGNIRSMKWTSLGPGGVVSNNFTAMYKDGYLTSTTIVSEVANYQKTINSTLSYEDGIIKTLSTESKEGTDTFRIDVNFNSTQSQPNPFYQFDIIPLVYLFIPSNFGDIFVCLASAGLLGHYS